MRDVRNMKSIRKQTGFTLIEILVTALIMGIGLLGLAGMQAVGLQQSQSTYFRTQADLLARDMADRMRANRNGAAPETAGGGPRDASEGSYLFDGGSAPAAACNSEATGCSPEQVAQQDLSEWVGSVENSLPAGSGVIVSQGTRLLRIQLLWDERRNGATGTGCDSNNEDDLACLFLNVEI